MKGIQTYTAALKDRPFGPVVERLTDLRLVDRRPDPVLRRFAEHEGRRWIKVYGLEADGEGTHTFSYVLAYEAPDDTEEPG